MSLPLFGYGVHICEHEARKMTFDELWVEIEKLHVLPDAAIAQVPHVLSNETKKRLSKKTPEEAIRILNDAIEQINRGSIETVDALTRKKL